MLQSLSCDTRAEARDVTTGDDNLDMLLITHLRLCKGLLQVQSSLGVSRALPVAVDSDYRGFDMFCLFCNSRVEVGCINAVCTQNISSKTLLPPFSLWVLLDLCAMPLCPKLQMHKLGLGDV